jgi:hypothetical protein
MQRTLPSLRALLSIAHRARASARFALAIVSLIGLAGCGGDGSGTSTLNLGLTDAQPGIGSVTKVWIEFTGVEVKPVSGAPISFSLARGFDLLTLQNGVTVTLLNGSTVPAGQYEWVRLTIDPTAGTSYVIDATGQHDLTIPSGAESGLKLTRGFTMPAGGVANFTLDFVMSKSLIRPPGQGGAYTLKPVLRMVDNAAVGTIAGTFQANTLAGQPSCATNPPVVYVYTGGNVQPDDIYNPDAGSGTPPAVQPLVTATAALNAQSVYAYRIPFVEVGSYTVAFTCDDDDPGIHESALNPPGIVFDVDPQPVTVTLSQTSTVDF